MLDSIARGRSKDVYGPKSVYYSPQNRQNIDAMIFRFGDSWSVPGWGRMPDSIPNRGICNAMIHHGLFQWLNNASVWQNYFRAPESMSLRKGATAIPTAMGESISGLFNQIGNEILTKGLNTHALGMVSEENFAACGIQEPLLCSSEFEPSRMVAVQWSEFEKPVQRNFIGKTYRDYSLYSQLKKPKVLPFFFRLTFETTNDSQMVDLANRAPEALSHLSLSKAASPGAIRAGMKWDFPILEMICVQDPHERPISPQEALAISGMPAQELQQLALTAVWAGGLLKYQFQKLDFALVRTDLHFGFDGKGQFTLMDSLCLDDFVLTYNTQIISDEVLFQSYSHSSWFLEFQKSKKQSLFNGNIEIKKMCLETPSALRAEFKTAYQQICEFIAFRIAGEDSFQKLSAKNNSNFSAAAWTTDAKKFEEALKDFYVRPT